MTKTTLSNEEWVAQYRLSDTGLEATEMATRRQKEGYIPALPVKILRAVVKAKATKALPLILAAHRQLHMVKLESVPLGGAIWDAAGSPSRQEKAAVLRNLKKMPEVIRLVPKHQTMFSFYDVAYGPLWTHEALSR